MRTRLLLIGFVLALVPALAGAQVGSGERRVGDSDDPTVASVLISQDAFPADGSAAGAVVATSADFADALAGSALAGSIRPILFTDGGDAPLREEVLAEIQRVVGPAEGCAAPGPQTFEVAILGGTAAVSAAAEQAVADAGYCVFRFGGLGREQTAIAIAQAVIDRAAPGPDNLDILLARRDNFADAAIGGAYAAFAGIPLVVTPQGLLHPDVADLLEANGDVLGQLIVLGGQAAISGEVTEEAGARVGAVGLVAAGATRDDTARLVAERLWPADTDTVVLVNGFTPEAFVYAIAAGPLSAKEAAPQLYTQRDQLTQPTIDYLASSDEAPAFAQQGSGVTQILSGPQSQIAFDPGEGFEGSAMITSGMPLAASVSRGPTDVATVFYPDVSANGVDVTSSQTTVVDNGGPPVWSSDHRHIYVPTFGDVPTVEMVDPATGTQETLFSGQPGEQIFNAVPSPDGQRVAIDSIRNGVGGVSVMNVGSDPATVQLDFYQHEGQDTFLGSHQVWAPDSGSVVVNSSGDTAVVAVVNVADGTSNEIGSGFAAAFNPSADQIARTDSDLVTISDSSGNTLAQLPFGSATLPIFSGDGQTLLVSNNGTATTCTTPPMSEDDCTTHPADSDFFGSASISTNGDFIAAVTQVEGQSGFIVQNTSDSSATVTVTFTDGETVFGPALPNYCPMPSDDRPLVNTTAFAVCP